MDRSLFLYYKPISNFCLCPQPWSTPRPISGEAVEEYGLHGYHIGCMDYVLSFIFNPRWWVVPAVLVHVWLFLQSAAWTTTVTYTTRYGVNTTTLGSRHLWMLIAGMAVFVVGAFPEILRWGGSRAARMREPTEFEYAVVSFLFRIGGLVLLYASAHDFYERLVAA